MSTSAASVVIARSVPARNGWQWIVDSWTLTAGYRLLFVFLVIAFGALAIGSSILPFIGSIAFGIATPVIQAGLMVGCDAMRRGEPLKFDHLFAGFERNPLRLLLLGGISMLAGIVMLGIGAAIVGVDSVTAMLSGVPPAPDKVIDLMLRLSLALLVAAALSVPVLMAMWFALPLIALRGVQVGAALSASFTGCLKNVLPFLVWSVAFLVIALVPFLLFGLGVALHSVALVLVGILPLMVGCLGLGALYYTSVYMSYWDVFGSQDGQ